MVFAKVLFNLTLAALALYLIVRGLSIVFDKVTDKITSIPPAGRKIVLLIFLGLLLAIPILLGPYPYLLRTVIIVGIYIILALSLNLILGFAGQLSIGHVAFYAIGAYTTALLTVVLRI